jgi:hypothetical protein
VEKNWGIAAPPATKVYFEDVILRLLTLVLDDRNVSAGLGQAFQLGGPDCRGGRQWRVYSKFPELIFSI